MKAVTGWEAAKWPSVTTDETSMARAEKRVAPRRPISAALPDR